MWTKNFKEFQRCNFPSSVFGPMASSAYTISAQRPAYIEITNHQGQTVYIKPFATNNSYSAGMALAAPGAGWRVGSGTTPATENDYSLESIIASGGTVNSVSDQYYDSSDNTYHQTCTFTISATTDLQISEIGNYIHTNASANHTTSATQTILLYRETFPTVSLSPSDILVIKLDLIIPAIITS